MARLRAEIHADVCVRGFDEQRNTFTHGSREPDAALLLAPLLVRLRPPAAGGCEVLIQDGYVDRTAAFGIASGPYLAARATLRWPRMFARCDLAVHVTADIKMRAERLRGRDHIDVRDLRSARDELFADRFHQALATMGRRHQRLINLDTTGWDAAEVARGLADAILALPRRCSR
ncbi:hypothetical protein [Peterkaempfera bronchialis]|uniref:hypothetical protein n=1 Tax=Peterkaempfera bronchialis TaxID=2126346 RepID=UPI003C305E81